MNKKIIGLAVALLFASPLAALADSTVTATHDSGSSVSPSGVVVVSTGATQTFSISAQSGFSIAGVSLDGVSQGSVSTVDFTGIAADPTGHTLVVTSSAIVASAMSGTIPYCSGPYAPGWRVDQPGGGCGATSTFVAYGKPTTGSQTCQFFQGCMVPIKN